MEEFDAENMELTENDEILVGDAMELEREDPVLIDEEFESDDDVDIELQRGEYNDMSGSSGNYIEWDPEDIRNPNDRSNNTDTGNDLPLKRKTPDPDTPVTGKWWFWLILAVVITAIVVYFYRKSKKSKK